MLLKLCAFLLCLNCTSLKLTLSTNWPSQQTSALYPSCSSSCLWTAGDHAPVSKQGVLWEVPLVFSFLELWIKRERESQRQFLGYFPPPQATYSSLESARSLGSCTLFPGHDISRLFQSLESFSFPSSEYQKNIFYV